jgi:hypothetical protein
MGTWRRGQLQRLRLTRLVAVGQVVEMAAEAAEAGGAVEMAAEPQQPLERTLPTARLAMPLPEAVEASEALAAERVPPTAAD